MPYTVTPRSNLEHISSHLYVKFNLIAKLLEQDRQHKKHRSCFERYQGCQPELCVAAAGWNRTVGPGAVSAASSPSTASPWPRCHRESCARSRSTR